MASTIIRLATALVAVSLGVGLVPSADAYPDKPIRLIVGFPPGGSSDAMARIVQSGLEKELGQPVVIENKPGAGAMIGIDLVAKSAPDGYTIGLGGAGAFGTNLALGEKMPYDPQKDIVPVTALAGSPFLLAAAPSLQDKSLVRCIPVPMPPWPMAAMEGGKLKPVAITSAKRFARLPDIPTVDESGVPGFETNGSFGIVAPAGTPPAAIAKLNAAFVKVLKDPEVAERMRALGSEPMPMSPSEFGAYIKRDLDKWQKVAQAAGAKPN